MGYVSTVSPYIFVTKIFVHCSKKLCLLHCCFVLFQLKVSLETFLHLVLRYPVEFMHQNQCIYDQRKKNRKVGLLCKSQFGRKSLSHTLGVGSGCLVTSTRQMMTDNRTHSVGNIIWLFPAKVSEV